MTSPSRCKQMSELLDDQAPKKQQCAVVEAEADVDCPRREPKTIVQECKRCAVEADPCVRTENQLRVFDEPTLEEDSPSAEPGSSTSAVMPQTVAFGSSHRTLPPRLLAFCLQVLTKCKVHPEQEDGKHAACNI